MGTPLLQQISLIDNGVLQKIDVTPVSKKIDFTCGSANMG